MSGFTGKTEQVSGTPADVEGLRSWLAQMLQTGGLFSEGESEDILAPYREIFDQENARTFAGAKESAGNITGSGYGKTLGRAAGEASTRQGGFLAQLLEGRRTGDADRMAQLMSVMASAGVSSPQTVYEPGFLDYLMEGAGDVGEAYVAGKAGK